MATTKNEATKDTAGVIAPPPLLYLGALIVGAGLERLWPLSAPGDVWTGWPVRALGGLLVLAGAALGFAARRRFKAAATPVEPWKPTTALVTSGPYARTRNPLYLTLTLVYLGLGLLFATPWILLLVPPLLLVVQEGVIKREERYLEARFGEDYRRYKAQVRRWL
jgi:protein-S-isoprenylcysteine O-methyltransferase Ste14